MKSKPKKYFRLERIETYYQYVRASSISEAWELEGHWGLMDDADDIDYKAVAVSPENWHGDHD